jgi:hypothetical protein
MDKTVKSYGSYLALYDEFGQEVTLHPKHYYFNEQFFKIYKIQRDYIEGREEENAII